MDEGIFVGWLKAPGERVSVGEPLFTLEGDKAAQEVEATDGGILRVPADAPKAGDAVKVGALLGYLDGADESATAGANSLPQPPAKAKPSAPAIETMGSMPAARARSVVAPALRSTVAISPRARRRAAELGLDPLGLKGRGRSGRITEADVIEAAKETSAPGLSAMRRIIAQRTAESFSRIPHFYLRTEVDAGPLVELRTRLLAEIEQATGARLTLTDLLLRAQALALRDCPFANAIWEDNQVVRLTGCDVGLVVGLDDGLLIPIVRAADAGGLAALAKQRTALVNAARAGTLAAEGMRGGATSLSNLGNTRVDEFAAVIASPQSSMLAVGRATPRPWVVDGQVAVRTTLKLCLSVDHRVMDGGPAAKFLDRIRGLLENPAELARE